MSYWIAKIHSAYPDESTYVQHEAIEAVNREEAFEAADLMVREERAQFEDYKPEKRPQVYLASLAPYAAVVAIYDCRQGYGGPEEGGWWYDYGVPDEGALQKMRVFDNPKDAYDYLDELRNECQRMNEAEKRYKHSALDTGWYDAFLSFGIPKGFPDKQPRYE